MLARPAGFVEVTIWFPSRPTHSDSVGHDTPEEGALAGVEEIQAFAPPAGRREVKTPPPPSARQNEADWQDTADIPMHEKADRQETAETWLDRQAWAPPAGCVEVMRFPALSPATHNDSDGQEIASRLLIARVWIGFVRHEDAPPAGFLEAIAAPPEVMPGGVTATHKAVEAHDSPASQA
jgi:hypothetical protein